MTSLLAKAFEEASRLPDNLQDELAEKLLEDLEGEEKWDATLANSLNVLDGLADRALEDYEAGRTRKMGFDEL